MSISGVTGNFRRFPFKDLLGRFGGQAGSALSQVAPGGFGSPAAFRREGSPLAFGGARGRTSPGSNLDAAKPRSNLSFARPSTAVSVLWR